MEMMQEAIKEARLGIHSRHGGPFGCVIVKDGKIVGKGHNEVLLRKDPTCHGEIMAIRDACKALESYNLEGCELYTTAEPCPMCFGAIQWANIAKVFYGCSMEDSETIGFRDAAFSRASRETLQQIARSDCLELFHEYKTIQHTVY